MAIRILHFVACIDDDGIPVAICLEHDLVTQANSIDEIRSMCEDMLFATVAANREHGFDPWSLQPPPDDAVAEFRNTVGAFEFEIAFDESEITKDAEGKR